MDRSRSVPVVRPACLLALLTLAVAAPLPAQGWLERAREAAQSTGLGMTLTRASAEAQLLGAARISLEESGLATLPVGGLTLGIAAIEVRSGVAVRLHAYLLNSSPQPVAVPVPDPELFVLVDAQGRRLERVDGPDVQGLPPGAAEISVPALERVDFTLVYAGLAPNAQRGTLKVGDLGLIPGIPFNGSPAPGMAERAPGPQNVWAAPVAPPTPPEPQPQPQQP